jgi:asparagine synthase (glutamine-hydrolysing)
VGKTLLRKAMQGVLPEKTFLKPKQGFSLNILKWWSGELGEEIRRTLPESGAVKHYFNMEYLRQLIPKANDSYSTASLLWHIYAFDIWHKIFVEKETNVSGYRTPQFAS